MFPNAFAYEAPLTLEEALAAVARHGDQGKLLAGGQSLLPLMKLRLAAPAVLIDLNRVSELRGWQETTSGLKVAALTRHAALERAEGLRARFPLLPETAAHIADPLVRNRGTLVGSLVHADPAADWGAAWLAMKGRVVAQGPAGTRTIAATDWFVDVFTTALRPDEIVTAAEIPAPPGTPLAAYLKIERKVGDFAVVGVALQVVLDDDGTVAQAGIGLAAVGPRPLTAPRAEAVLTGTRLQPEGIREAAQLAAEASDPVGDQRGSAAYKRAMVRQLVERGLTALAGRSAAASA